MPGQQQRVARQVARGARDAREVGRARRAVDEGQAVEQGGRADRADDEVLQPRLERGRAAHLGRAQHVERDREQLEPEEQRHQVLRGDEHPHARGRGEQQREVLAVRRLARRHRAPRQQHGRRAARAEHEREHDREVVEAQGAGDEVLLLAVLPDAQADGGEEARQREQRDEHLAHRARAQQAEQEHERGGAQQRQQRRQPGPVDVRTLGRHRLSAFASLIEALTESSLRSSAQLGIEREREDDRHERRDHQAVGEGDLARGRRAARRGCASRG